ncbi:MAG: hypothetical protein ACOC0O_05280 [Spirochaetota bacterium]
MNTAQDTALQEPSPRTPSVFGLAGRIVGLFAVYLVVYVGLLAVYPSDLPMPANASPAALFGGIMLTIAVDTGIIALLVLRSRWRGWKLAAAVGFAMYGVITVMSVSEAWYFGPALGITPEMLPELIVPNLFVMAVVAPLSVLILGRFRAAPEPAHAPGLPRTSAWIWVAKLVSIVVVYCVLYFAFGMIVAWQNPAVQELYDAAAHPEIFALGSLLAFQVIRALVWVVFALPVIRMTKGRWWAVALTVALLFALPMNVVHFQPNPFMPDPSVRMSHFVETTVSNFLYGLFVVWVLLRAGRRCGRLRGARHA